jgi:hypothetical protein
MGVTPPDGVDLRGQKLFNSVHATIEHLFLFPVVWCVTPTCHVAACLAGIQKGMDGFLTECGVSLLQRENKAMEAMILTTKKSAVAEIAGIAL